MPMSPEELEEFLADPRMAHFATIDAKGRPRVRPIWYLWREGAFWFTTRLEARHTGRDVTAGPTATTSIASEDRPYRAVIARGEIEVVGKDEALLWDISSRYGEREARAWLAGAMKEPDRTALKLVPRPLLSWNYGRGDSRRQSQGESMHTAL